MSIRRAYGAIGRQERHSTPDLAIAAFAVAAATSVRMAPSAPSAAPDRVTIAVLVAVCVAVVLRCSGCLRPALLGTLAFALSFGAMVRSDTAWSALVPDQLGAFEGWARIVDDPQVFGGATRVVLDIEGERFETWQRRRSMRLRAESWRGGDQVHVQGDRTELDPARAGRVAWAHVVGEFELEWAGDVRAGSPVARASNRVRGAIERGASTLPGDDGALLRGLVVGDDRDQPREMIDRFRASGLSHLTAVSGQNVAFVLAAAGPLLVRLRPASRWAVTLALVAWFVALTRFEPSIVRAGAMAALSATGFALGRQRSPFRLLCWAVIALLIVDPLLAWSVGFWLSVGATAGVTTIGPWLAARLARLGVLALPLGVTLGAQAGVVIPAVVVFGRLPLVSIPANLLAVPVAGFVMLYGLPAGIVAGLAPPIAPVLLFPCRLGVRWVDTVAALAARLEPGGAMSWLGWAGLVVTVVVIAAMNRDRHGSSSADR